MNTHDSKVLVTGGAGFIGSHLVHDLLENGATVHVIDNEFSGERSFVPDDATYADTDVRADGLREEVTSFDPDAIVHLAALHYIPYCNEHPEEAFEVNAMGTRNLLESARDLDGLQSVVYASTAAVYPPREAPHSESDDPGPDDVYGRTKLIGEDLVEGFGRETGIRTPIARLFNTYGRRETNPHLIPAIFDQLANGSREIELGNLEPRRDFVHVSDVVRALVALLRDDSASGPYNVGSGEAHSVAEVVELTRSATGESLRIVQDEDRVRESDRPHLEADVSKMASDVGWTPQVSLRDGLERLWRAPPGERCVGVDA